MKAVILAGGEGTRLRPLTLRTPKPVVPVVDRPFLRHQLDLLATVGVHEIVFSLAYRPEAVQAVFGDGTSLGRRIEYAVESTPLGTGGACRNAVPFLDDVTIVLNGDVLTDVDLRAVVEGHRERGAVATLVLTRVENPSAYGLVETATDGRVHRFIEKPKPEEITTDTINAGIYVLDTKALELIPEGTVHSIERGFFPELLRRGDRVFAHVHRAYWIDIGTPEKYLQVHRDVLRQRFPVALTGIEKAGGWIHATATVSAQANLVAPFFIGADCLVAAGATVGPDACLVDDVAVEEGASVSDTVAWVGTRIRRNAKVRGALLATGVEVGASADVGPGTVLGDGSHLSPFSLA
jgi:NDP-sugar pyrophosphorylase family protein